LDGHRSFTHGPDPNRSKRIERLIKELVLYNERLASYPRIVAGNKRDLPGTEENLDRLCRAIEKKRGPR